jgi:hypothetical protein
MNKWVVFYIIALAVQLCLCPAEEAIHGFRAVFDSYHLAKHQDVPLLPAAPVCCFNRELRLIS